MARPTKLSPVVTKRLVNAFKKGASVEAACSLAAIDDSTYYNWIRAAKAENATPELLQFFDSIKKAQAQAEMAAIASVIKASNGFPTKTIKTKTVRTTDKDGNQIEETETVTTVGRQFAWQAAAWLLERKYPERWGRLERREEDSAEQESTGISWERLTDGDINSQATAAPA